MYKNIGDILTAPYIHAMLNYPSAHINLILIKLVIYIYIIVHCKGDL